MEREPALSMSKTSEQEKTFLVASDFTGLILRAYTVLHRHQKPVMVLL